MTTATTRQNARPSQPVEFLGFAALMLLNIGASHYWPGSVGATVVKVVYLTWVPVWLAFRIRAGYRRRRPHWTAASWLRYLKLAAMPVISLALVLYLSSFDKAPSFFGAPRSPIRGVWIVIMLGLMILGVTGLIAAIDWLTKGEPSEQFTRTRWFQRRRAAG
ncbi:MAG TPA: hypothetical protein VMS54_09970 [Vicinamibacterales bacterium]|nr:hypothetical protein [Vicinamibacterales bacterium]